MPDEFLYIIPLPILDVPGEIGDGFLMPEAAAEGAEMVRSMEAPGRGVLSTSEDDEAAAAEANCPVIGVFSDARLLFDANGEKLGLGIPPALLATEALLSVLALTPAALAAEASLAPLSTLVLPIGVGPKALGGAPEDEAEL